MANQKANRALLLAIDAFTKGNLTLTDKTSLRKALALVQLKLGKPCCQTPSGSVRLVTPQNNNFTNTVRMILNQTHSGNDDVILQQAEKKLLNLINNPCC